MSKGSHWQRLIQFAGAHMHEEIKDDRLDRAVRVAAGDLVPNPPFVEATLQIDRDTPSVLASAISPEGMVAVLLGAEQAANGTIPALRLVTWKNGIRADTRLPENAFLGDRPDKVILFFPEGSLDPLVLVDDRFLYWANRERKIQHSFGHPVSNLVARINSQGNLQLAWRVEYDAFHHHETEMVDQSFEQPLTDHCSWLGLVDGSLAIIKLEATDDGVVETLYWRDIHFRLPYPRQNIIPETISETGGGIQFVTRRNVPTIFWTDGKETRQLEVLNGPPLLYDRGKIYAVCHWNHKQRHLVHFNKAALENVGQPARNQAWPRLDDKTRVMVIGNTVIIYRLQEPEVTNDILCLVTPDQRVTTFSTYNTPGVGRFHNWLTFGKKDGTFGFDIAIADTVIQPVIETVYPLYGQPFGRLTEVEDQRGKAIMSWAYTYGTLHILRYPLPKWPNE